MEVEQQGAERLKEIELLPCPLCGKAVYIKQRGNSVSYFVIVCEPCRLEVKGTKQEQAIATWNGRLTEAQRIIERALSEETPIWKRLTEK